MARESTKCDPDAEGQPFVNCEMTRDCRDNFHQKHGDGYDQTECGYDPFEGR